MAAGSSFTDGPAPPPKRTLRALRSESSWRKRIGFISTGHTQRDSELGTRQLEASETTSVLSDPAKAMAPTRGGTRPPYLYQNKSHPKGRIRHLLQPTPHLNAGIIKRKAEAPSLRYHHESLPLLAQLMAPTIENPGEENCFRPRASLHAVLLAKAAPNS